MRYIIVERDEAYMKFEIEKTHLAKVKTGSIDLIIDTEEDKYFAKGFLEDEPSWHDMKLYDKRFES